MAVLAQPTIRIVLITLQLAERHYFLGGNMLPLAPVEAFFLRLNGTRRNHNDADDSVKALPTASCNSERAYSHVCLVTGKKGVRTAAATHAARIK